MMSRKQVAQNLVVLVAFTISMVSCSSSPTAPGDEAVQEYVPDANTVMLDHLNSATLGTASDVTYAASCSSLGDCCLLDGPTYGAAAYVQYSEVDPLCISEGTVEAWVWLDGEFDDVTVMSQGPFIGSPAGWTFHLAITRGDDSDLHVRVLVWDGFTLRSDAQIPLRKWTHVAFTWGGRGAEIWVNGRLDVANSSTAFAAPGYGGHLILRTSSSVTAKIDEVRISDVQRDEFYVLD